MEPQRRMLEALGIDGMSSDEEEKVSNGVQYRIITPRWRAPALALWLRVFDAIYIHHRTQNDDRDQRGALPRRRVATTLQSTSKKFVSGLPINAYKTEWLEEQLDIANIVHPTEVITYTHDPQLSQCVFFLFLRPTSLLQLTTYTLKDSPYIRHHVGPPCDPPKFDCTLSDFDRFPLINFYSTSFVYKV